ncbi:MAG: class I SAM-dependent methyltransferase [Bacteroidota bacterium]
MYFLSLPEGEFEQAYLRVRQQEGRLYPDRWVRQLPELPKEHPHHAEWRLRQYNTKRLLTYLKGRPGHTWLDLGCGNGWLAHRLAAEADKQVLGVDINLPELEQAVRLFDAPNCRFAYGDVFEDCWPSTAFDGIILNSCIQYFSDLDSLIDRLRQLLRPKGEIHILDSPFYEQSELAAARDRSRRYYEEQGVVEMQGKYHHHSWESLQAHTPQLYYQPQHWTNRLRRRLLGQGTPFPWIIIRA